MTRAGYILEQMAYLDEQEDDEYEHPHHQEYHHEEPHHEPHRTSTGRKLFNVGKYAAAGAFIGTHPWTHAAVRHGRNLAQRGVTAGRTYLQHKGYL